MCLNVKNFKGTLKLINKKAGIYPAFLFFKTKLKIENGP